MSNLLGSKLKGLLGVAQSPTRTPESTASAASSAPKPPGAPAPVPAVAVAALAASKATPLSSADTAKDAAKKEKEKAGPRAAEESLSEEALLALTRAAQRADIARKVDLARLEMANTADEEKGRAAERGEAAEKPQAAKAKPASAPAPAPAPAPASALKSRGPGHTAYVCNFSFATTSQEIKRFFESHACEVARVTVALDGEGKSRGFAHVAFASAEAMGKAALLDGIKLNGRALKVDVTPRSKKPREPEDENIAIITNLKSDITARQLAEFFDARGCIINKIELQHEHNWQTQDRTKVGMLTCDGPAHVKKVYDAHGSDLLGRKIVATAEGTTAFWKKNIQPTPATATAATAAAALKKSIGVVNTDAHADADDFARASAGIVVEELPPPAAGEKIVFPVHWLRAFGISFIEKEISRVGPGKAAVLCPADVANYCDACDFRLTRPVIPKLDGSPFPTPKPSSARYAEGRKVQQEGHGGASNSNIGGDAPTGGDAPRDSHRPDGSWDTAEAAGQSKREVNLAEQQRLHFEKEREAILAERQAQIAAAFDAKAAAAAANVPRKYHDEGDEVMASLMESATSGSVVDNNVGKIAGFAAEPAQAVSEQYAVRLAGLEDEEGEGVVDSFLRDRASRGGTSMLAGGLFGLGAPPSVDDDIFGGSLSLDFGDTMIGNDENMFDFDALLSETELVGSGVGFVLDEPAERIVQPEVHVSPAGAAPLVAAAGQEPSASPAAGIRVSMSALFASKASASSTSAPKAMDVLSLYEVEAGETIAASEKERIATTPPSEKTVSGSDASPFAFHGTNVTAKTSTTKKKPAMSAASRMQLLKMQKKTPTKSAGGEDGRAASPAGAVRVDVNALFGK